MNNDSRRYIIPLIMFVSILTFVFLNNMSRNTYKFKYNTTQMCKLLLKMPCILTSIQNECNQSSYQN